MLRQIFLIAWRNLLRNRLVSFINIAGLATGITACILIFLYVNTELSYDRHWKDGNRIYRVTETVNLQDKTDPFALTDFVIGPELQKAYPEIEEQLRLFPAASQTVWVDGKMFTVENNYFADSTLFRFFDFKFLKGNPLTALNEPKTTVISSQLAKQLFGDADPMGKPVKYSRNTYTVTGVVDINENPTHLSNINAFLSMNSMVPQLRRNLSEGGYLQISTYTYLKLGPGTDAKAFEPKLQTWVDKVISPWLKESGITGTVKLSIQALPEIHFDTYHIYDLVKKGNRKYVIIFACIAIFLLLIACFNYMNLTTAQAVKRAREVAVKKVAGATRSQLIRQFLGESLLLTFLAFLISIALVEILLPGFNKITENENSLIASLSHWQFWLVIAGMLLITGLAGGSYPAFYLSNLQPVDVLRASSSTSLKSLRNPGGWLGKALVVMQFSISISMIAATLLVMLQLNFIQTKDLGFTKDEVVIMNKPGGDSLLLQKINAVKAEFLRDPHIKDFATGDHFPGSATGRLLFLFDQNGKKMEQAMNMTFADYDYARVLGLTVSEGRWFSREFPSDQQTAYVVNEAAADFLNLKTPLGKELECGFMDGKIIGVVKDYNYASLHKSVEPMVFMLPRFNYNTTVGSAFMLKVDGKDRAGSTKALEANWKRFFPNHPVNFYYLDQDIENQYRREETMLEVFGYFAALTILISCLGLFALAAFATEKRTKEIGIRKVMGASVKQIISLILNEFAILVLISILIATPLTWFLMNGWLADFAYRISIPAWIFLLTGCIALLIASITVIYHAARAALSNPVQSLRYE